VTLSPMRDYRAGTSPRPARPRLVGPMVVRKTGEACPGMASAGWTPPRSSGWGGQPSRSAAWNGVECPLCRSRPVPVTFDLPRQPGAADRGHRRNVSTPVAAGFRRRNLDGTQRLTGVARMPSCGAPYTRTKHNSAGRCGISDHETIVEAYSVAAPEVSHASLLPCGPRRGGRGFAAEPHPTHPRLDTRRWFPLSNLESRLKCPMCGSRHVAVILDVPSEPVAKRIPGISPRRS
jgi:DNA-directed RNA polymerase subunit RPC12/RpoP